MKLGSLFDGSGGFPLAGVLNGIEPIWASEIEPFPIRVTTKRFPQVKHYGNICEVNGAEVEPVDIITGGSPCQDLSVAGKRAGMKHSEFGDEETTRSGLFMEQIRIIKEMREATNGRYPRYMVWENVPGAFSSNKGKDFQAALEETIRIANETATVPEPPKGKWSNAGCIVGDGYSVAWRVLDAQYWGVPQRRRRIFLVADFRGESAGEILFKSRRVSRDSAESREAGEGTSENAQGCAGAAVGFDGYNSCLTGDASATRGVNCGMSTGRNGVIVLNDQGGSSISVESGEVSPTLRAQSHQHEPVVCLFEPKSAFEENWAESPVKNALRAEASKSSHAVCYGIGSYHSAGMMSDNPRAGFYEADTARTLDLNGGNPACNQGGIAVLDMTHACDVIRDCGEIVPTLQNRMGTGGNQVPLVAFQNTGHGWWNQSEKATTIRTACGGDSTKANLVAKCLGNGQANQSYLSDQVGALNTMHDQQAITDSQTVRRLTPLECSRLQGFPDWLVDGLATEEPTEEDITFWTEVFETHRKIVGGSSKPKSRNQIIKWLKDPYSDSAIYKMWGNGVALPCVEYVMEGIAEQLGGQV